jgi:hypothetical protein
MAQPFACITTAHSFDGETRLSTYTRYHDELYPYLMPTTFGIPAAVLEERSQWTRPTGARIKLSDRDVAGGAAHFRAMLRNSRANAPLYNAYESGLTWVEGFRSAYDGIILTFTRTLILEDAPKAKSAADVHRDIETAVMQTMKIDFEAQLRRYEHISRLNSPPRPSVQNLPQPSSVEMIFDELALSSTADSYTITIDPRANIFNR